jgi:hypothetical protein
MSAERKRSKRHLYHGTNTVYAKEMQTSGLCTSEISGHRVWIRESETSYIYVTIYEAQAESWGESALEHVRDEIREWYDVSKNPEALKEGRKAKIAVLRFKESDLPKRCELKPDPFDPESGDMFVITNCECIPPEVLEIKRKDKWIPLKRFKDGYKT